MNSSDLEKLVLSKPGITSEQLWAKAKLLHHKLTAFAFDNMLEELRERESTG